MLPPEAPLAMPAQSLTQFARTERRAWAAPQLAHAPWLARSIVFGGAPIINVLFAMTVSPPKTAPSMLWYLGIVLASVGAGMVLYFRPHS